MFITTDESLTWDASQATMEPLGYCLVFQSTVNYHLVWLTWGSLAPPLASLAADLGDKWEELSLDMATLLFGFFVIKALTRGQERKKCTRTCKCLFVAIVCTDSAPLDCELFWLTSGRGFPWINWPYCPKLGNLNKGHCVTICVDLSHFYDFLHLTTLHIKTYWRHQKELLLFLATVFTNSAIFIAILFVYLFV